MKNELIGLDDSETSICDPDPEHIPAELYTTGGQRIVHESHSMFVPSPLMRHGPAQHHIINMHSHHTHHAGGGGPPIPLHQALSQNPGLLSQHQLGPNMTPIDKLYSMQNSYFAPGSAPSECEC